MKLKSIGLTAAVLALLSTGAEASTLTYDLTLMNGSTPEGSGTFTINGPVASTGLSNFTAGGGLTSLSFSIENNKFGLSNQLFNADVTFQNGNLISIAYAGALNGLTLELGTLNLNYAFADFSNWSLSSVGTISASPVAATPLPPTWTMMFIGLAGFGLVAYRMRRKGAELAGAH